MNDLDILLSDEFRRSVEDNLARDPVRIALDRHLPHAALVASQVKYLRRAECKLPSYRAARCIIPPLAFEQSSSEETAARKTAPSDVPAASTPQEGDPGRLCIDLTCGLGVDAFFLSKKFERVIALERDPQLAAIARENFRRLGAHNIEVINSPAEEFLSQLSLPYRALAQLIYADPDRRGAGGRKMVRIEDCSPDIVALLPLVRQIAPRLVVKLSPLFDAGEVFRIFGPNTRVEVVSLGGECKEIIAEVMFPGTTTPPAVPAATPMEGNLPSIRAVAMGIGEAEFPFGDGWTAPGAVFQPERYRRLVVPDVALQKARVARRYFAGRLDYIDSDNGYGFTAEINSPPVEGWRGATGWLGKIYEIEAIEPFDPKGLKRRLKAGDIRSVDIMKRGFPLSSADIARQLGISEGGTTTIAFTRTANGRLWQITIKK